MFDKCKLWILSTDLSRISQLKTPGFSFLYPSILASISGVASFGLLPPSTPGLIEPVSWYLHATRGGCYCYLLLLLLLLLLLPIKNLANTAVADPELPADDAGPHPGRRHLDDLQSDVIREGAAVDKNSPQLINPALP